MSQFSYLVPVVQSPIGPNSQVVSAPKYLGADFTGSFCSIPYGFEPLCLLTLPASSSALAAQSDVYTFGGLTEPLSDEAAAVLSGFLIGNNIPDDGILSGDPAVVGLVYVARIFLLAQSLNQAIFTGTGVTLVSPASSCPAISAAISVTAQPTQSAQGVGNAGVGNIGTGVGTGTSGGSGSGSSSGPFNFTAIADTATVAEFLDGASTTWTGGPIVLGSF
jgi:hypothetical protein